MQVPSVPVRHEDVTPALAAASIAHELSQPLTAILSSASMCVWMLDADPPNLDAARTYAKTFARELMETKSTILGEPHAAWAVTYAGDCGLIPFDPRGMWYP